MELGHGSVSTKNSTCQHCQTLLVPDVAQRRILPHKMCSSGKTLLHSFPQFFLFFQTNKGCSCMFQVENCAKMIGKIKMPQASCLEKPSCMACTSYFLFISSHSFCQMFAGSCTPPTPSSRCFMCIVFMSWWSPLIKWKVSSWNLSAHHSARLLVNRGIFHYRANYLE